MSFTQAYEEALEQDPDNPDLGFFEGRREQYSRKLYLLAIPKLTAPDLVFITRPNTGKSHIEMDLIDLRNNYRKIKDPQDAKAGWDSIYEQTGEHCIHGLNCKIAACSSGGRKQTVKLVTGAVVPIWNALESTIMKHRLEISKVEASLRVVRVTLSDDGQRRLVGVRFPNEDHILTSLIISTNELNR